LTQRELGRRAGLSQQAISLVERGHGSRLSGAALRRLFAALDARWEPVVSWRGGEIDRLLDAQHARLVGAIVRVLGRHDWTVEVEVTYSEFGERGSIDVLAWKKDVSVALVVEGKSELVSVEATLRKLDEKVRLTRDKLADARLGTRPRTVGRLLRGAVDAASRAGITGRLVVGATRRGFRRSRGPSYHRHWYVAQLRHTGACSYGYELDRCL